MGSTSGNSSQAFVILSDVGYYTRTSQPHDPLVVDQEPPGMERREPPEKPSYHFTNMKDLEKAAKEVPEQGTEGEQCCSWIHQIRSRSRQIGRSERVERGAGSTAENSAGHNPPPPTRV